MASNPKQFLRRLQSGDSAAWTQFVDEYGGRIHALARRFAATEADAEDLTQEIFVQLSSSLGSFRGDCALSTWVYRVSWNQCCRWQKTHRSDAPALLDELLPSDAPDSNPEGRALHSELSTRIDAALGALSDGHRDVVVLHEMHGLTYAECARVLDIPIGTVKSRLSNAFRRLRTALRPYVQGEDERTAPTPPNFNDSLTDAIGGKA